GSGPLVVAVDADADTRSHERRPAGHGIAREFGDLATCRVGTGVGDELAGRHLGRIARGQLGVGVDAFLDHAESVRVERVQLDVLRRHAVLLQLGRESLAVRDGAFSMQRRAHTVSEHVGHVIGAGLGEAQGIAVAGGLRSGEGLDAAIHGRNLRTQFAVFAGLGIGALFIFALFGPALLLAILFGFLQVAVGVTLFTLFLLAVALGFLFGILALGLLFLRDLASDFLGGFLVVALAFDLLFQTVEAVLAVFHFALVVHRVETSVELIAALHDGIRPSGGLLFDFVSHCCFSVCVDTRGIAALVPHALLADGEVVEVGGAAFNQDRRTVIQLDG